MSIAIGSRGQASETMSMTAHRSTRRYQNAGFMLFCAATVVAVTLTMAGSVHARALFRKPPASSAPPTIDGVISPGEWDFAEVEFDTGPRPCGGAGDWDLSGAKARLGWDTQNVYGLIEAYPNTCGPGANANGPFDQLNWETYINGLGDPALYLDTDPSTPCPNGDPTPCNNHPGSTVAFGTADPVDYTSPYARMVIEFSIPISTIVDTSGGNLPNPYTLHPLASGGDWLEYRLRTTDPDSSGGFDSLEQTLGWVVAPTDSPIPGDVGWRKLDFYCVSATRYVATTGNNTGNDCSNPAHPCATVQYGVDAACPGDIVSVAAGTYNEQVKVFNKTLTLQGARHGADARAPRGAESVLTHAKGPLQICADNVTVDGFTVEGAINTDFDSFMAGIWTNYTYCGPMNGGYLIVNNIIQNNIIGLYPNSNGTNPTLIQHNWFKDNNIPGPAGGTAIYSDLGAVNVLIDSNKFTGSTDWGIIFTFTNPAGPPRSNITISNNVLTSDAAIGLVNVTTASITGNVSTDSINHGMWLGGGNDSVTIRGNNFIHAVDGWSGIRLRGDYGGNSNITILENNLLSNDFGININSDALSGPVDAHFNRIFGNLAGINNDSASSIDATNNWWGCNAGPGGLPSLSASRDLSESCFGVSGGPCDTATGPVTFNPWLVLRLTAEKGQDYPHPDPPPAVINQCETSKLDADLTYNSDCSSTYPPDHDHIPDGAPAPPANCTTEPCVTFGWDNGSVSPSHIALVNGIATSTFSPGCSVFGDATTTATVDNETASAAIIIQPTAPWVIKATSLRANLRSSQKAGFAILHALINDTDTVSESEPQGDLSPTLLANHAKIQIYDSTGNFNTGVLPLTNCRQLHPGGAILCNGTGIRASLTPLKNLPYVYTSTFIVYRLPGNKTGIVAPHEPIQGKLYQDAVCRFDCIDSVCRQAIRVHSDMCIEKP